MRILLTDDFAVGHALASTTYWGAFYNCGDVPALFAHQDIIDAMALLTTTENICFAANERDDGTIGNRAPLPGGNLDLQYSAADIASYFNRLRHYRGNILIATYGVGRSTFATRLAMEFRRQSLALGCWVYGWCEVFPNDAGNSLPSPEQLSRGIVATGVTPTGRVS